MRERSLRRGSDDRIPILYLAPWVDIGGSDTATVDWFRTLDRSRFAPSLITTQTSRNLRLGEIAPYADELWELPELIPREAFPRFILAFLHTREIRIVHIMNSQIAFELLPDIATLRNRPRIVVQFHGEEPEGAGYVRYVSTRFGNLVDAFSIATGGLTDSLGAYDVPTARRRTIPIGVDAEGEFCPDRNEPIEGLDPDVFHVLFPARLTAQKNPLLMVEVAARLRSAGLRFQIHVVGDGDMEESVRDAVARQGLQSEVLMQGASTALGPWYAACQAVLLTSAFETGPPCAAYEAMAMGKAIVAPELPAIRELVVPGTGVLIESNQDAEGFASALGRLAGKPSERTEIGAAGRARVLSEFSLQRMAREHEALYDELLASAPPAEPAREAAPLRPAERKPASFSRRGKEANPLVSVIVTCFDQGRYLPACLQSVASQSYSPIETIVVDDRSTDPETVAMLDALAADPTISIVRLPANRGPAAARNAGIEPARGRYILPLDGDDLLVESAVTELVAQLVSADEQIGFVYPNLQFFGNRSDYLEMPTYNLHALLGANQCSTSSLFDREIFDRGLRFPEEMTLGHEDWDFVLTLAEHGVYGEVALNRTLLVRRQGFTRSELVEVSMPFAELVAARHPALFSQRNAIKSEWNPGLSLIVLGPIRGDDDVIAELANAAARQTCGDFELIIRNDQPVAPTVLGGRLRHTSLAPDASPAVALTEGLDRSRGRYALAVYGDALDLLSDRSLIEKVLRIVSADPALDALALADCGPIRRQLQLLTVDALGDAPLVALCWDTTGPAAPPGSLSVPAQRPLELLARWIGGQGLTQWRHLHRFDESVQETSSRGDVALPGLRHARAADARLRRAPVALPECPPGALDRIRGVKPWEPPQSRLICRHRHAESRRYLYSNEAAPPPGYALDRILGWLLDYPYTHARALVAEDHEPRFTLEEHADPDHPRLLGFVEQRQVPFRVPLVAGQHRYSDQSVLSVGDGDPLSRELRGASLVGYIEPYPQRQPARSDVFYGLTGLIRTVDLRARRHRYGAGHIPAGVAAGELGALFLEPTGDCCPLWIDHDGRAYSSSADFVVGRPSLSATLRWASDPLTWTSFGKPLPKLRASARRTLQSSRLLAAPTRRPDPPAQPAGYLLRTAGRRTVPLLAAIHPVTGDQLLSTEPSEAVDLGYEHVAVLGHLLPQAPVTGRLGPIRAGAPWASRFGLASLESLSRSNGRAHSASQPSSANGSG